MGDSNLTGKEIIIENVTYGTQLMKKDRLLRYRGHSKMLDHGPLWSGGLQVVVDLVVS